MEAIVHFSKHDMRFVPSSEKVDYEVRPAELIHRLFEGNEVLEPANVSL